ncbi:hypothetical protein R1flu_000312 [Riccia fluitans]|uniref:Uncharacterized protein n=1 Tax=Riccia fluitans TaxID=41844 RepID=A0ABD1Y332_9MARC
MQVGWSTSHFALDGEVLQDGFWPLTDHSIGYNPRYQDANDEATTVEKEVMDDLQAKDEIFVGEAIARKIANFVPLIDIASEMMLLIHPSGDFEYQDYLRVVKAIGLVCQDESNMNINKVSIKW